MELKNVLIIKGSAQYGVMRDFADALAKGFSHYGLSVDYFDASLGDDNPDNIATMSKEYDLVLSFNGMLLGAQEMLFKNPNSIFWTFLVDHPYHHHWRMLAKCNNHVVSCVDRKHVEYIKKYYQNIEHSCFIPHGGNIPSKEPVSFENRKYQVCLMGTYGDLGDYERKIDSLPEPDKSIVLSITSQLKAGSPLSYEELFDIELKARGLQLPKKMYTDLINALAFVDPYIRAYNRTKILDALTSSGIVVDVFGNGWDKYPCKNPDNLILHGNVPYEEVLSVMSDSKIVINPLPLFRDGSHERVFSSMLCGAICLSEINTYLSESFNHGEEIVFFQMDDMETMAANVKALLSNNQLASSIAKNGYQKAITLHLWENRAKAIIDTTSSILAKQRYNNTYIDIKDATDYRFNCLANYIDGTSPRTLANKLKSSFHFQELNNYDYANALFTLLINTGKWPKEDIEGNIYSRDITKFLKGHLMDYIKLYNSLDDDTSKSTLLGILNNYLSMDTKDLARVIAKKDDFESTLSRDVQVFTIENPLDALILFVTETLPNLSSNKIYLRYYEQSIIPGQLYVYVM